MQQKPIRWQFRLEGETMTQQTVNVSVSVNPVAAAFTVKDAAGNTVPDGGSVTMPNETVGTQVDDLIVNLSGGTPPYTESVTSGQPPSGVNVNAVANPDGSEDVRLQGTPDTAGASTFTIQVSDSAGVTAKVNVRKVT
jgi:hypothetical protein